MTFWELLFLVMGLLGGVAYSLAYKLSDKEKSLCIKAFASVMFVALGAVCCAGLSDRYAFATLLALSLGMLADIIFGYRHVDKQRKQLYFKLGVAFFAAGHIVYIFSINMIRQVPAWIYLLAVPVGLAVCWVPKHFSGAHYGKLGGVLCGYAVILASMLLCAVYVFATAENAANALLLLVAAVLFSVSDTVLLYESFVKETFALNCVNLMTYYPAQLLFALTARYLIR